jgi:hypothetical protein
MMPLRRVLDVSVDGVGLRVLLAEPALQEPCGPRGYSARLPARSSTATTSAKSGRIVVGTESKQRARLEERNQILEPLSNDARAAARLKRGAIPGRHPRA